MWKENPTSASRQKEGPHVTDQPPPRPRLYIHIVKGASRNRPSLRTSRKPPTPSTASPTNPPLGDNDSGNLLPNADVNSLGSKLQVLALTRPELLGVIEVMVNTWLSEEAEHFIGTTRLSWVAICLLIPNLVSMF